MKIYDKKTGINLGTIGELIDYTDSDNNELRIGDIIKHNDSNTFHIVTNKSVHILSFCAYTKYSRFSDDLIPLTKEANDIMIKDSIGGTKYYIAYDKQMFSNSAVFVGKKQIANMKRYTSRIFPKIIFSEKCTIAIVGNDKAIVRCHEEEFEEEKGMYMALLHLNGYTNSRLTRELERLDCATNEAEKAYAYALLVNKYSYTKEQLAEMLKNAKRQEKKTNKNKEEDKKESK